MVKKKGGRRTYYVYFEVMEHRGKKRIEATSAGEAVREFRAQHPSPLIDIVGVRW